MFSKPEGLPFEEGQFVKKRDTDEVYQVVEGMWYCNCTADNMLVWNEDRMTNVNPSDLESIDEPEGLRELIRKAWRKK